MVTNVKLSSALRGNKNAAGKRGFKSAAKAGFSAAGAAINKRPMLKAGLIGAGIATAAVGKGAMLIKAGQQKSLVDKARDAKDKVVKTVKRTVKKAAKAVKPG